jgi:nitroimidazol reductase NimA-like FMN-containing flavoprotein (pyridoxamine 5'-phosphate oxidase superfamily)
MSADPELDAMARRVIQNNRYLILATLDPDGRPRVSPVYYTHARYSTFYWVSSPEAHHSRNIAQRSDVEIVIFDSTAAIGKGEATYLAADARAVPDDELDTACVEAFHTVGSAVRFTPDELRDGELRLYAARARSCEVHVPGGHPRYGRVLDSRQPADPSSFQ